MANRTVVIRSQNDMPSKKFKVIVIGDSNVGKTALTYRFCSGKFKENTDATIGVDFRTRTLQIDGEEIELQIWDTAGHERFRHTMVRHYYKNARAVVFVYDVTNMSSFQALTQWIDECNQYLLFNVPWILVGNKCDDVSAVSTNVAQQFADFHNMPLFETSAKLDSHCDNVEAIFITLAHKLKNNKTFFPRSSNIILGDNQPTQNSNCCFW